MAFDWSALSDEELVRAIRTAPVVLGPWAMCTDGSYGTREYIGLHAVEASVMTWSFGCKGYAGKDAVGPFDTLKQAMDAVDELLRSKGIRLLDSLPKEVG